MDAQVLSKVWASAHQSVNQEVQATLPIVEGQIPSDLRGVLYRNGPGRFSVGGQTYGHLFDGDGLILRFAIGGTSRDSRPRIRYRNRFVRTHEFVNEERTGRLLYRGLGTNLPGGLPRNFLRLRFKNPANTNVVYHGGRLLALWEGGLPYQLDPVTLDTLGRCDFGGALRNRSASWLERQIASSLPFSAHPKIDPQTGDLYNFGVMLGASPRLHIYRVDTDGELHSERVVSISHEAFVHDFCITPSWFVFFLAPIRFDSGPVLLGLSTGIESLQQIPGAPTRVLLVPRAGGEVRQFVTSPCFVFHFANAHEDPAGHILVDGCRQSEYPHLPPLSSALAGNIWEMPVASLTRYTIDPGAEDGSALTETPLMAQASEFPRIHPAFVGRPYRYVFGTSATPGTPYNLYTSIVRQDLKTGQILERPFAPWLPGEPVFVPRPGADPADEGDGYLLTVIYHGQGHCSALHILDARSLDTVCVAQLPHHTPPGFHGNFVPAADCPPGWAI
jgi:all-trans-8'-apo-beta-carotenal 15,15'-oxygenase